VYTDWSTFGDSLARSNYNPNETTLSANNVPSLKLSWSKDLGAAITDQPVIATNVSVGGTPTTVAYIGTEAGGFYALNADTGATIWSKSLGTVASGCLDLPGGTFGVTGTATFDKATHRVYVADGKDQVHALDMATGAEAAGWPVTVTSQFTSNHIYGALTFNPNNGMLYAETGSFCDTNTWNGRIVAINTSSATIAATFFPGSPYNGAGVWGIGGVAIDPSTNDVYLATGNTEGGPTEYSGYGDQVVHLNASLGVVAANYPGLSGSDVDFGSTPMLYSPPGCAQEASAKNKSGVFVTYFTASLASGPIENLNMAPVTSSGIFIGTTAYSPVTNLVYVGDPDGNATYTHGLVALAARSDCTLALSWQQTVGPANVGNDDNDSATVANGVVYFTDGQGNQAFAFDAATGQQLWNSGATITGTTQVAPTVDGRLFVSSWDHKLYAFGL
jgi:outer membrane protein assembly factor BamB